MHVPFVFRNFPCGVLGQVWYMIVSIPDLCLLSYFTLPSDNENCDSDYKKLVDKAIERVITICEAESDKVGPVTDFISHD